MQEFNIKIFSAVLILFLSSNVFAQHDSVYNFLIPGFRLYQNEKGKKVYYEFDKKWNLVSVNDSFFIADRNKYSYKVNLKDISEIGYFSRTHGSSLIPILGSIGFVFGFVIGGTDINIGGSSGKFHYNRAIVGGLLTGGAFALIGAGISLIAGGYHYDEFNISDFKLKKKMILKSLSKHKSWK